MSVTSIVTVGKSYSFAAAHKLYGHQGKCRNLHGHNYVVEVAVNGPMINDPDASSDGMVIDFQDIDEPMKKLIEMVDHQYLNEIVGLNPTTAENIACWFAEYLRAAITEKGGPELRLEYVRVWETDKCWAEWRP